MKESIIVLSDDAVIIDGRLFTANTYPNSCPKCYSEIYWDSKDGFYPRPGCLKCDIWFDKVYCKP